MSKPQTLNGLMRHLRNDCNIKISGSYQKQQLNGLKSSTFEYVYKERMKDNTTNTKLQSKRLKLRNSVYSKLSTRYHDEEGKDNQMIRHFYSRGEDAPLWVVFEILYLSDLASFF